MSLVRRGPRTAPVPSCYQGWTAPARRTHSPRARKHATALRRSPLLLRPRALPRPSPPFSLSLPLSSLSLSLSLSLSSAQAHTSRAPCALYAKLELGVWSFLARLEYQDHAVRPATMQTRTLSRAVSGRGPWSADIASPTPDASVAADGRAGIVLGPLTESRLAVSTSCGTGVPTFASMAVLSPSAKPTSAGAATAASVGATGGAGTSGAAGVTGTSGGDSGAASAGEGALRAPPVT